MYTVYLVEDEERLNELLTSYLTKEGWQVRSFTTGTEAWAAISAPPHLWILDIMLPDIDGYQLIREIKQQYPAVPVIFISARDAELDRVVGLEMGSDDYLPKPFLPRELVIRTRRLLERIYGPSRSEEGKYVLPPYTIDTAARLVTREEEEVELTSLEYDLLLLFALHVGQALSRQQILDRLWGDGYVGSDRVVDDLVRRLRRKMPRLPVETLYGYGYRLVRR